MTTTMTERVVNSFDKRLGWYVQEVWRYPQPEPKGGISPDVHPAAIEDKELSAPDIILINANGREGWQQGYSRDVIANYLRINGPATVSQIAEDVQGKPNMVTGVLRRNPDVFEITNGAQRGAIWGLVNSNQSVKKISKGR